MIKLVNKKKRYLYTYFKLIISIFLFIAFFNPRISKIKIKNEISNDSQRKIEFDKNFDYIHYETDFITEKMKKEADWILQHEEIFFINGLIRKHKPKNCLEIGVAKGGSSILILNAIKDIPDSLLISIDIRFHFFGDKMKKTGYLVEEKFHELVNKWKLFLGDMPYKFLPKLNKKFDFVFLDAAHYSPGEFINLLEILPFLNENAIIVLHDITWQFYPVRKLNLTLYDTKIMPTNIFLMSSLVGEKIIMQKEPNSFINIGAVYLENNQKQYYLNYFLLLMTIWHYIPTDEQLKGLREYINKYYNDKILIRIYDFSVDENRKFFKNLRENKYKIKYNK